MLAKDERRLRSLAELLLDDISSGDASAGRPRIEDRRGS
jgi:hypothetical protein